MFDETKETQNAEQQVETTSVQETVNPYLASASAPAEQESATEETVTEETVAEETVATEPVVQEVTEAEEETVVAESVAEAVTEEPSMSEEAPQEQTEQSPWQAAPAVSPIPEEPKKNPAVKVAVILAIVAVVLIIAIVAVAFSGLFGNKKAKVAQAFKATMEESEAYLKEVWQVESYEGMFESKESSIEMDLTLPEDITMEATIDSTEEETDMVIDIGLGGSSLAEIEAYANETQIFFAIPDYFDYLFYIDIETLEDDIEVMVENGMIDSYTADTLIDALEMEENAVELSEEAAEQLQKDINTAWKEMFEAVKVEEIDSEEFTVNDEDVECDGYAFKVTPDILADITEATMNAYQDNDEVMEFLEYLELSYDTDVITEGFEVMEESVEELRDIDKDDAEDATFYVNVYLYDGKVAHIDVTLPGDEDEIWFAWSIEGGNFPLENTSIELVFDGDEFEFYRSGSMEDDEYWVEYEFVDEYGTSYVLNTYYVPESGEFEIDFMEDDYWNWLYTYGTIEKTDKHTLKIEIDTFEIDEEEIMYGDIVIMDECGDIEKPEGEEEINILTMSEEEWEELIMEAYLALY